jgi:hypothetical protein
MQQKKFTVINESFTCDHCGQENEKLAGSCRNHCKHCLYSKHVDKQYPGDRRSECKGKMQPISIDHNGKKGFIIIHECEKCLVQKRNKVAHDDNMETVRKILTIKLK